MNRSLGGLGWSRAGKKKQEGGTLYFRGGTFCSGVKCRGDTLLWVTLLRGREGGGSFTS